MLLYVLFDIILQVVRGIPCEVQEISTRASTGGSFTLMYNSETTKNISWDASSDEVQAALEVWRADKKTGRAFRVRSYLVRN